MKKVLDLSYLAAAIIGVSAYGHNAHAQAMYKPQTKVTIRGVTSSNVDVLKNGSADLQVLTMKNGQLVDITFSGKEQGGGLKFHVNQGLRGNSFVPHADHFAFNASGQLSADYSKRHQGRKVTDLEGSGRVGLGYLRTGRNQQILITTGPEGYQRVRDLSNGGNNLETVTQNSGGVGATAVVRTGQFFAELDCHFSVKANESSARYSDAVLLGYEASGEKASTQGPRVCDAVVTHALAARGLMNRVSVVGEAKMMGKSWANNNTTKATVPGISGYQPGATFKAGLAITLGK